MSLLYLIRAIAHAHARTRATSLIRVKNSTHHFYLRHLLSGTFERRKSNKDQKNLTEQLIIFL